MIKKVDAICLIVENLSKSREFYEKKLGLKIAITDTGFIEYKLRGTPLALFEKKQAIAMFPQKYMNPAGGAVIALKVEHVYEEVEELIKKGVKIFEGPKKTPWNQTVAYFKDPDGHILEITD